MPFMYPHSHAFRRGRVTIDDDQKAGPGCLVEFGDGVTVIAECRAVDDAIISPFRLIAQRREHRSQRGLGVSSKAKTAHGGRNAFHESMRRKEPEANIK